MDARDLSEFIIPWRADSKRTGKPIEPVVRRMSGWGQAATSLTSSALVSSRVDSRHPAAQAVGSIGTTACPSRNSQGTAFDG